MDAEEILAGLSQEARFELTLTVTPAAPRRPPGVATRARIAKLKRGKTKTQQRMIDGIMGVLLDEVVESSPHDRNPGKSLISSDIPHFDITGTATVFGKQLTETFRNLLPEQIKGSKEELKNRFHWHIRNIYLSKKVALGSETSEVSVEL
jgi:hypothetical protein